MAAKFIILAFVFSCLAGADAARAKAQLEGNQTADDESGLYCADYCMMCNDGSTVWYGRSKSWFRGFITLFTEGLIIPVVGVTNMFFKASKEQFSHWTGYLPTTGLFCEKVDVIKFPIGQPANAFQPLITYERNWFGKISMNELKPYTPQGYLSPKLWAQNGDLEAYVHGCKPMKASGASGALSQFQSNFESFCTSQVTTGVFKCSEHSRLCGKNGVHSMVKANSYQQCQALKGSNGLGGDAKVVGGPSAFPVCPLPGHQVPLDNGNMVPLKDPVNTGQPAQNSGPKLQPVTPVVPQVNTDVPQVISVEPVKP